MVNMAKDNVRQLRPRGSDSEKITINLGYVDLGQIDLLVDEGFYSNRTDFIRTAIRNQIERQADVVKLVARGHSNKEIADQLFLAETTVKGYVSEVLAKYDLRDRTQLVVLAYESGFVRPGF